MRQVLLLLFILLSYFSNGYSQKAEIILNKTIGHVPYLLNKQGVTDEDSSALKLPRGVRLKFYNYYYFNMAPIGEAFRKYKNGEIKYDEFLTRVKRITHADIDTARLANYIQAFSAAHSKIHFISGIDTAGDKVILVDANQDGLISNDEIFTFSPAMIEDIKNNSNVADSYRNVCLNQIANNGTPRLSNIKILPYSYINRNKDTRNYCKTDFVLQQNDYWAGSGILAGQSLTFYASSKTFANELNIIQFRLGCNNTFDKFDYDIKDDWSNDKISLSLNSLNYIDDKKFDLVIDYQSPPRKKSDTTFLMSVQNVANYNFETLHSFLHHKKYILIDYWGTWCVPCIAKIPDLKQLQSDYSGKVSVISIAYDFDINMVNSFEKSHNISWSSYYIDRMNAHNLTKPLKVVTYPTFRLYNENGTLIFDGQSDPDKDLRSIEEIISK